MQSPEYRLQQLMVLCPITQLALPTGISLNAVSFATAIFTNVRVQCPHCGSEHRWNTADAFLVEFEGLIPPPDRGFHQPPTGQKSPPRTEK